MTRHPIWELLDKLQMDANDLSKRIDKLRIQFAAIELPPAGLRVREHRPYDQSRNSYDEVRALIGRTIHDAVDLESELRHHPALTETQRVTLVALLPPTHVWISKTEEPPLQEATRETLKQFVLEHGRYPLEPEIRAWADSVGLGPKVVE